MLMFRLVPISSSQGKVHRVVLSVDQRNTKKQAEVLDKVLLWVHISRQELLSVKVLFADSDWLLDC